MVNAATAAAGGDSIGIGEGVEGIAKQAELEALRRAQQNKSEDESQSNKRKFVPATNSVSYNPPTKVHAVENGNAAPTRNVDEINIDDIDDDGDHLGIQQKAIPAAVFGNVQASPSSGIEASADRPRIGALDRFNI